MRQPYDIGQTVLVKLPSYSIHRRAVVNGYNKESCAYTVALAQNGAVHEVMPARIKELPRSKSAKKDMDYKSDESEVQSSIASQKGPTRRLVNVDEEVLKPLAPELSFCAPVSSTDIVLSPRAYMTLIALLYAFFGLTALLLLNSCFNYSCDAFRRSVRDSFGAAVASARHLPFAFLPFGFLFSTHLILYSFVLKSRLKSRILDCSLPLLIGAVVYGLKRVELCQFGLLLDYVPQIMVIYLIFSVVLLFISLFRPSLSLSYEAYVFFEQHSVLLGIVMLIHQALHVPYPYVDNLSFYYLFFLGYTLTVCLRIHPNNARRVNFLSTLFARPFLLTVPVLSAIAKVTLRWHILYYLVIFLTYTVCLVLQIEPRKPELQSSKFYVNFIHSITKLCMASLAGLDAFSLTAWVAVFVELAIDLLL